MPFCPKCNYEYKRGIIKCPDCDEALVEFLPDDDKHRSVSPKGTAYKDWVRIVRLTSPQYAEMVIESLRAKGIPAVLQSGTGHFGQTGQFGISSFRAVGGGYSLMVPQEYVNKADEIGELILGDEWKKGKV